MPAPPRHLPILSLVRLLDRPHIYARDVTVTKEALTVELSDGRSISVLLAWFPRLMRGTPDERSNWRLIGQGAGPHWPAFDKDVSVEDLLTGRASSESQRLLKRWLSQRASSAN